MLLRVWGGCDADAGPPPPPPWPQALRTSKFAHLRAVFAAAKRGAVFVFMDASFHLWQEVVWALGEVPAAAFAVLHPHPQPLRCHNTMLLVKTRAEQLQAAEPGSSK